jgi:hypothetical protein
MKDSPAGAEKYIVESMRRKIGFTITAFMEVCTLWVSQTGAKASRM